MVVRVKCDSTFSVSEFAKTAHFKSSNTEAVITGRQPGTNGLSLSLPLLFSSRVRGSENSGKVSRRRLKSSLSAYFRLLPQIEISTRRLGLGNELKIS